MLIQDCAMQVLANSVTNVEVPNTLYSLVNIVSYVYNGVFCYYLPICLLVIGKF